MKKAYITRAILKDYLTIKNVDITFNEGINIIIGKNGTGKTNFINYLGDSLLGTQKISDTVSDIYFNSFGNNFLKEIRNMKFLKNLTDKEFFEDNLIFNVRKVVNLKSREGKVLDEISTLDSIFPLKISHGIPTPIPLLEQPFNNNIKKLDEGYSLFPNSDNSLAFAIGFYYFTQLISNVTPNDFKSFDINNSLNPLNKNLSKYSNIKKARIGRNFDLKDLDKKDIYFNNLYLEYLVNDEWILFHQLSDGTKRLLYIITEITFSTRSIILLEEPELGLHPEYLHSLMQFIKEMSEKFQFIITTHSPMVLDALSSDELGNIIISKIENGETKLEHLSSEQMEKAKVYMRELDLSDYWIHSDLED